MPTLLTLLLACHPPAPDSKPVHRDSPADDSPVDTGDSAVSPPEGLLVLHGGTVVDVDGVRVADVWVDGATIWAVTTDPPPSGSEVIDVRGGFLTPGLVDAHVHLAHSGATVWTGDPLEQNLRADLYHGVLEVYDLGGPEMLFAVRDAVEAGELLGPHILATGPFLTAVGSHPCESAPNADLCTFVAVDADPGEQIEAASTAAAARRAAGADAVKVALADADFTAWPTTRLDLQALAEITAGGPTIAHVDENADVIDAIGAGVSVLAHPVFAGPMSDVALGMVGGVPVESTVGAFAAVGEVLDGATDLSDDGLILGPGVLDNWIYVRANPEVLAEGWADASADWALDARDNLPSLRDAGAIVIPGSDAGYYFVPHGTGLQRELAGLVDAGWTPLEALAAATATASDALGFPGGRIAAGQPADLLVLGSDPSIDVAALDDIDRIVLGGVVHPRVELRTLPLVTSSVSGFCLTSADCAADEACDGLAHVCGSACPSPGAAANTCGGSAYCLPIDALSSPEGVCHPAPGLTASGDCDLYMQDCRPSAYQQACVPFDGDTNGCWTSGPRAVGQTCSWDDADLACGVGLYCSLLDSRCYALCDPAAADTCPGARRCVEQESAPGVPWFGVCI